MPIPVILNQPLASGLRPAAPGKLAVILLLALALACAPQQAKPSPVLRATLDNGLRVVIVPNPLAPVATLVVN